MLANLVSLDRAQPWLGGGEIVSQARVLRWFEPLYVPGLLQTEAYARAVFEAGGLLEAAEVEARLNEWMEGQRILYDEEHRKSIKRRISGGCNGSGKLALARRCLRRSRSNW